MEALLKLITNATKVISWITLRKVLLLSVVGIFGLVGYTVFENRAKLASTKTIGFTVSVEMQDRIKGIVVRTPTMLGIEAYHVDLKTNERTLVHQFYDDSELLLWLTEYAKLHGVTSPMFSMNDSVNSQLVRVINGEFFCVSYKDSGVYPDVPKLGTKVKAICRISLPPYYGEFSGFFSVLLSEEVVGDDKTELELALKKLANELFYKNIVAR